MLAGCAGLPGGTSSPTPTTTLADSLREVPGVVAVEAVDVDLTVVVAADADDETVLAAADAVTARATERAWEGEVRMTREHGPLDPATDLTPPAAWDLTVYPPGDDPDLLPDLLEIERIPGVATVSLGGWPSVGIDSLDEFSAVFHALSALPRFADGGTYAYAGEAPRLLIVHIADRMTTEAIDAVIRIAVEHPRSEVELQSMTTGPRWPELYVSHLTPEEVVVVDAQLRDAALADADLEGYSVPFQLSYVGPDGPVYSFGTFGDVPDTSS